MNLTMSILMWMIGLKIGMDSWYYFVIVVGYCFHLFGFVVRRANVNPVEEDNLT